MPTTKTGDGTTFSNTLQVPIDTETASAASVWTGFQRLLDNGKYLYDRIFTSGVLALRRVADQAALAALTGMTTGQIALVDRLGAFMWIAGDATTALTNWVVADAGNTGRWVHWLYLARGAANGLASLDAGAKVPTAQLSNAIIGTYYSEAGASIVATGTFQPAGVQTFTAPIRAGDLLEAELALQCTMTGGAAGDTTSGQMKLGATPTAVGLAAVMNTDGADHRAPYVLVARVALTSTDEANGFTKLGFQVQRTGTVTATHDLLGVRARILRP